MSKKSLNIRYNTLLSFQRILNTFYAIANYNLSRLKKTNLNLLEEELKLLAPILSQNHLNNTENNKHLVILFFSNKGLCGGYNSSINKKLNILKKELNNNIDYIIIGSRGERYIKEESIIKKITCKDDNINTHIEQIINITDSYKLQNIHFIYNNFINILTQKTIHQTLYSKDQSTNVKHLQSKISNKILYHCYLSNLLYCIYINTRKSEEAMRIHTTFNAKKNTENNIEALTLQINKLRKMLATTEILETSTAAEALKNNIL